jgi:DNA-binding FadR family transcriptional regulator
VSAERQARAIRDRLLQEISSDTRRPGQQLPTEREISERFGASRYTVRKVLAALEKSGSIVRRVGLGTFVARDIGAIDDDLRSITKNPSPAELMEIRLLLEPGAARLAAGRASEPEIAYLQQCLARSESGSRWQECERWDGELHRTIIAATKNASLIRIADFVRQIRREQEWSEVKARSMTDSQRRRVRQQHRAIVEAISSRNGAQAEQRLRAHLLFVKTRLLGLE